MFSLKTPTSIQIITPYIGFFLVIFGIRLIFLNNYASSTPFFDDWDMGIFVHRYAENSLNLIDWLTPANQHQMLFSKIINVILFQLNSWQWDTLNVLVFNSILWSFLAIFFISLAQNYREEINAPFFIAFILVLWVLPISIISSTWAIVSHNYFMMSFLLLSYWGIGYKPLSIRWIISIIALVFCAFTIGAGILATAPLLIIFTYRLVVEPDNRHDHIKTLVAISFVAFLTLSSTLFWPLADGSTDQYLAKDTLSFFSTLLGTLSWPLLKYQLFGLVLLLPAVTLTILVVRKSIPLTPLPLFTLALTGYMTIQAFGIAYARNNGSGGPMYRYYELLLLAIVAQFLALLIIQNKGKKLIPDSLNKLIILLWIFALYIAIPDQINIFNSNAAEELTRKNKQTYLSRSYLRSGDAKIFTGHSYFHLPYPRSHLKLAYWLDRYKKLNTLPMELQVPNNLIPQKTMGFTTNGAIRPITGTINSRYYGENVIGSYNLKMQAQHTQGHYESQVFEHRRPYLMIPTLGFLGLKDELFLEVVELDTGKITKIKPAYSATTPEIWQYNYLKTPKGRYQIRARDESTQLWFAFAAPREVGLISYFVRKLIKHRTLICNLGFLLLLLGLIRPITKLLQCNTISKDATKP